MKSKHNGVRAVLLWATTVIFMMPIYWLLISSLKTDSEITMFPPTFWPRVFAWKNYPEVWHYLHFARTFMNSIIVSATATLLIVLFSTMAGYAFAKKDFIGKNILMIVLVGTMTIPAMTLLLPLFVIITRLGMYDRLIGLILPFSVTVFGIYFMKQYIADVPDSLERSSIFPMIFWKPRELMDVVNFGCLVVLCYL